MPLRLACRLLPSSLLLSVLSVLLGACCCCSRVPVRAAGAAAAARRTKARAARAGARTSANVKCLLSLVVVLVSRMMPTRLDSTRPREDAPSKQASKRDGCEKVDDDAVDGRRIQRASHCSRFSEIASIQTQTQSSLVSSGASLVASPDTSRRRHQRRSAALAAAVVVDRCIMRRSCLLCVHGMLEHMLARSLSSRSSSRFILAPTMNTNENRELTTSNTAQHSSTHGRRLPRATQARPISIEHVHASTHTKHEHDKHEILLAACTPDHSASLQTVATKAKQRQSQSHQRCHRQTHDRPAA